PRWYLSEDFGVYLEPGVDPATAAGLIRRGHVVEADYSDSVFGGAQAIVTSPSGYRGASDPRKDGCAAGF
ncbi:MAG: gamma-glutamyltransferase, partial [Proteobacteria bacterium]